MRIKNYGIIRILGISLVTIALNLCCLMPSGLAGQTPGYTRLGGHIPAKALEKAVYIGRLPSATTLFMSISLPLRNQQELDEFLAKVSDPADPLYGHYLTTQEFTDRFCPTQEDYDAVIAYARSVGLKVTGTQPNRILLGVAGTAGTVEAAFKLHLHNYRSTEGRVFYAPDDNPAVADSVASIISGVIGLDNSAVWHSHAVKVSPEEMEQAAPLQIGTGPGGGLTPSDVLTAYNLSGVAANGSGQVLGLFELDGYNASDITGYTSHFGLRAVPLQNVLVDGFSGGAGSGADEVTLDIELQNALAPGASQIMVYEGPNTNTGVVATYNQIAIDNLAKEISTSWGLAEDLSSSSTLNSENTIFKQMAAQGQSIFAASGDRGAYDDGTNKLTVDDPASQPYMVGVGGTQLFVNSGETYNYESTWNNGSTSSGAGGGGVSSVWSIPSWQQGISTYYQFSPTMRNVPDVSLNSDQYTGYSVYYKNAWYIFGGTSCAAPLWAAFTARVNQQRLGNGLPMLGFPNPPLYQVAESSNYSSTFHDIKDGSTNLYYVAVPYYDNATGWGSFNGANLLASLSPSTSAPSTPTGLTAAAGDGSVTLTWNASSGAASYNVYRSTTPGGEGTTPMVSGITSTSYTDNNLTDGVTYYYQVSATNSNGTSALSNEASATPTTLSITSGPTAAPGKASANINWTTNPAATSVVRYGTSSTNLSRSASNSTLVTSHSVRLGQLSRHTTYYYQVSSTAGADTVASSIGSFRTQ